MLGPSVVLASLLHFYNPISPQPSSHLALAQQQQEDELQQQEDRSVHLFQVSLSLSLSSKLTHFSWVSLN